MKTGFGGGGWERGLLAAWALVTAAGCYDVKTVDPGIEALPDEVGRVDVDELDIHGQWFSYGDNDDWPQSCTQIGLHSPAMCSVVLVPKPLPSLHFPNQNGVMCTAGSIGEAMPCIDDVVNCKDVYDYSNMWGAGIGLDFGFVPDPSDGGKRDPVTRNLWDAPQHHVAGVAFDLQLFDDGGLGGPHLRIEFPMRLPDDLKVQPGKASFGLRPGDIPVTPGIDDPPADYPDAPIPSEEHPKGSPYWGAGATFRDAKTDLSPVRVGHNVIHFSDTIRTPESDYSFAPTRLLGIQFHVPSFAVDKPDPDTGEHFSYGFCISNLTFLRE